MFFSFDATYLYQYTFILLYGVVFTSLPVIALGGKLNLFLLAPTILISPYSLRPGHKCKSGSCLSTTLLARDTGSRLYKTQVLVLRGRRSISVSCDILHPLFCLVSRPCTFVEREGYRVSSRFRYNNCSCSDLLRQLFCRVEYALVSNSFL